MILRLLLIFLLAFQQLIAHAATGCLVGAVGTGNCGAGAAGQLAGEVSTIMYGKVTADGLTELTQDWQDRGVDVARLSGALATSVGEAAALAFRESIVDDINALANDGTVSPEQAQAQVQKWQQQGVNTARLAGALAAALAGGDENDVNIGANSATARSIWRL